MPYSYPITGSSLYVTIVGVGNVEISDINATLDMLDTAMEGTVFQLFDAGKVVDQYHIYYAVANAYYAVKNGYNISDRLEVESLLYASAQDQISKAINFIGVTPSTRSVAVAVVSEAVNDPKAAWIAEQLGDLDDSVLDLTDEKYHLLKRLYNVSELALEAVGGDKKSALRGVITEKGALISLKR